MKDQLEHFIRTSVKNHNEEEINAILDIFSERKFLKGEHFKHRHTICKNLGFITSGSTRSFMVKENGEEVTASIIQQDNFIAEVISIRTNKKTPFAIEFLEDSTVLVTPISTFRKLLEHNLTFNILMREYIADQAVEMGKRHFLFLTGTAKERYQFFLEHHPVLLKKFPLRLIASMIGITPTQLSRIRNKKED